MAVKRDLKKSLLFLARDRAQSSQRSYVHQPVTLLEKNRRKAAEKRYNGIITARNKFNAIQAVLDKLATSPEESASHNRKSYPSDGPVVTCASPIPGFRYHYNGDERKMTKKVMGAEKLSWMGSHLVDNKTLQKWKKSSSRMVDGSRDVTPSSAAPPFDGVERQIDGGPFRAKRIAYPKPSPHVAEEAARSPVIARRGHRLSSFSPRSEARRGLDAGSLKRYRKQMEKEGRRMVSMMGANDRFRGSNSYDVALFQDITKSKAEIMLKVISGTTRVGDVSTGSNRPTTAMTSRKPAGTGSVNVTGIDSGRELGRDRGAGHNGFGPCWREVETEGDCLQGLMLQRPKDLQARIDNFLRQVKRKVEQNQAPEEYAKEGALDGCHAK